jgi:hypothetical protein
MLYRSTNENDLEALQLLGLASYGRLKKEMSDKNWLKMEALITSDQTFPVLVRDCFAFVCEENNRLIGMAFLVPSGNPTKIYSTDTSYIRMVGVHPEPAERESRRLSHGFVWTRLSKRGKKQSDLHSAEVVCRPSYI